MAHGVVRRSRGMAGRWIDSRTAFVVSIFVATACAPGGPSEPPPPGGLTVGDHTIRLSHDGQTRTYNVHVPSSGVVPLPVLLAFHGGGGNAGRFQESAAFDVHADRNGYVVVYPDGTGRLGLHTWNAGGCCGTAREQGIDDVGFVRSVVVDLAIRLEIDLGRVYATGHSNGSMMAHRLAAEAADLVAAIAPYAGAPYFDVLGFSPSRPVPVLHTHSADDPRALYHGGLGPPFPLTGVRTQMNPVERELDRWIARNGCASTPVVGETVQGDIGTISEGHTATLHTWNSCSGGSEVRLLKLTGAGHGWPGIELTPAREAIVGPATAIIEIEEEIWSFVSQYTR